MTYLVIYLLIGIATNAWLWNRGDEYGIPNPDWGQLVGSALLWPLILLVWVYWRIKK